MLSDLIKNKKYTYKLSLHKMNYEYIMPLRYTDISFIRKFNDYDELTVSVPQNINIKAIENNIKIDKTILNPAWVQTISGGIILMKIYDGENNVFSEYFSIQDYTLSSETKEKELSCIAAHQVLFNRLTVSGYDQIRKMYEYKGEVTAGVHFNTNDNSIGGILNYIIENKLMNQNYSTAPNFWKVTYYDTTLNNVFEYNKITEEQFNSLKNNIASYWYISRNNKNLDKYTGNVSKQWDDGTNKFTVQTWANKFQELLKSSDNYDVDTTGTLTELYVNRLYLQNTINYILEKIDDATHKLYFQSSFDTLKADTYIGTKLLTAAEEAVTQLQGFIDAILTENNVSEDDITSYIEECMLLFQDLTQNLISPLLIFKGCSGVPPYRYLTLDGVTLTEAFSKISDAYSCYFEFDNVNREIKIYNRESDIMNVFNNISISDKTFIQKIQRQDNHEQIITRLYLTGKDESTIAGITPTGNRYWDDFSYFMSTEYMSPNLINALSIYQNKIDSFVGETGKNLTDTLIEYDQKYNSKYQNFIYIYEYYVKYVYASAEYEDIGINLNKAIHKGDKSEIEVLREEQTTAGKILSSYEAVLNGTLDWEVKHWCGTDYARIYGTVDFYDGTSSTSLDGGKYAEKMKKFFDNCYVIIDKKYQIQNSFKYDTVTDDNNQKIFSEDMLAELENFIFEADETADTISDNRALLYYAKNYMKYINTIPVTVDVSLIDILSNKKYQSLWERLNKVGDYISIDYPYFNLNKSNFRLLSYTHNPLSGSLEMNFSNSYELKSIYNTFINGVVKTSLDLSKSADKYQDSWNEYLKKKELYLQEGQDIDARINSIRSNGKLIVGKDGITLSKQPNNAIKQYADGLYCPVNTIAESSQSSEGKSIALGNMINIIDHSPTIADLKGAYTLHVEYSPNTSPIVSNNISSLFLSSNVYVEVPAVSDIIITPAYATVKPNGTVQFSCSESNIVWSASGGTITQNGLFTATDLGNAEVTVRSNIDSSKYAKASVSVRETRALYLFNNSLTPESGGILTQIHQSAGTPEFSFGSTIKRSANIDNATVMAFFKNMIDVTPYSTIKMHIVSASSSSIYGGMYDLVGLGCTPNYPTAIIGPGYHYGNSSDLEFSFDLNISGSVYIGISQCTGTIEIDKVWLE